MRLVDKKNDIIRLNADGLIHLLADILIEEMMEVHEDNVGIAGRLKHHFIRADIAAELMNAVRGHYAPRCLFRLGLEEV